MTKSQAQKSPEEIYGEATEDADLSSGDLRLLTSGLMSLRSTKETTLNKVELQALYGMIAYVAYSQEVNEVTVCEILTANYGVAEIKDLCARHYQNAIEFLVDLKVNNVMN